MGHGYYGGGAGHYHAVTDNLSSLTSSYDYNNGYFGERGKGRNFVRNIKSDNPIKTATDFYKKASSGGREKQMNNGLVSKMKDGTIISFRIKSSSDGSPVVEINIRKSNDHGDIKYQKIHFIKE